MKKSAEIKQELARLIGEQRAIADGMAKEKRSEMNEAETSKFDELQTQIEARKGELDRAIKLEENLRSVGNAGEPVLEGNEGGEGAPAVKTQKRSYSLARHIRSAINGKLTGAELEVQQEAIQERNALGLEVNENALYIPASMMRASQQTVAQDSAEYGGQLVNDQTPVLIDGFMPKLYLEQLGVNVWTGLSGGDVPLPVSSNYTFQWLDEGETITSQKQKFVGPKLSPKRAGALVGISKRLLNQSSLDVEMAIKMKLQSGIRIALEGVAIDGLAVNKQPVGVLNLAGVLTSSQVSAAAATYARAVELQGLIEDADATENSLGYLCGPKLKAALKTISKGTDMGGAIFQDNKIDGVNTVSTSLVKKITGTPDTHPLIYGDWSQMYIGVWGGIEIIVDGTSTAAAAANSVNLIVNMNADMQIANPKAFAVNTLLTA